jgi:hypothetical protein
MADTTIATPAPAPAPAAPKPVLTAPTPGMAFPPPSGSSPEPKADDGKDPWADVDNEVKPPAKPPEPEPKAPEKPAEPPKPAAAPAKPATPPVPVVDDPDTKLPPAQLRAAKKAAELRAKTAETKLTEAEARLAAAESKGQNTDVLAQRLAAAEKERDAAQQELRIARYEPNDAVKAARKTLNQVGATAKRIITSLEVNTPDGGTAPADWNKFLTNATNLEPGPALKWIRETFGDNAQLAMNQYFELTKHTDILDTAEREDRDGFNDRVTRETATRTQAREGFGRMVTQVRTDIASKNPDFAPSPDDPEADALFKKGRDIAQLATSEQYNSLSPNQQAVLVANMELRAAAYPRMRYLLNKKDARIAALEAENAELRGGALPPEQRPGGVEHPSGEKTFEQDLEEASKEWVQG